MDTSRVFIQMILSYVLLGLAGLGLSYVLFSLRFSWHEKLQNISTKQAWKVLWIGVTLFVIIFSVFGVVRYATGVPAVFDQGNMEQALWNTSHGEILRMTTVYPTDSRLAFHVEPILIVLAPLYNVIPDGRMLILLQVVVVGLGAYPLFRLARHFLLSPFIALLISCVYLLYPAVHQGILRDFHPLALGTTFMLFGILYFFEKKWSLSMLSLLGALTCREEFAVMVFLFGVYALLKKMWSYGFVLCLVGLLWTVIVLGVVFPTFNSSGEALQFGLYEEFGETPLEIISTAFSHPIDFLSKIFSLSRIDYILFLFIPVLFLSFRSLPMLLIGIVSFATIFLRPEQTLHIGMMHHHVSLVAPVFVSLVLSLQKVTKKTRIHFIATAMFLTSFFLLIAHQASPLSYARNIHSAYPPSFHQATKEILSQIPPDASIATVNAIGGHGIAHRKHLVSLTVMSDRSPAYTADFVVLPTIQRDCTGSFSDPVDCLNHQEDFLRYAKEAIATGLYVKVFDSDGVLVLQKTQ